MAALLCRHDTAGPSSDSEGTLSTTARRRGFAETATPAGGDAVERPREAAIVRPLHALVAQLDRASDFESEGGEFESLGAGQAHRLTRVGEERHLILPPA